MSLLFCSGGGGKGQSSIIVFSSSYWMLCFPFALESCIRSGNSILPKLELQVESGGLDSFKLQLELTIFSCCLGLVFWKLTQSTSWFSVVSIKIRIPDLMPNHYCVSVSIKSQLSTILWGKKSTFFGFKICYSIFS